MPSPRPPLLVVPYNVPLSSVRPANGHEPSWALLKLPWKHRRRALLRMNPRKRRFRSRDSSRCCRSLPSSSFSNHSTWCRTACRALRSSPPAGSRRPASLQSCREAYTLLERVRFSGQRCARRYCRGEMAAAARGQQRSRNNGDEKQARSFHQRSFPACSRVPSPSRHCASLLLPPPNVDADDQEP